MTDKTRTTVIAVVTAVWAANFLASLLPFLEYKSDQAINGIFMTIVGGLFALGARKGAEATAQLEEQELELLEAEELEDEPVEEQPRQVRRRPPPRRRARPAGPEVRQGADSDEEGEGESP